VTEMTFRNTTKMLEEDDPVVWINSFSGQNLRWEAIGVLFTYWAFGAISSPEDDPIFFDDKGNKRDRRQYMIELKECASSCIALCNHVERRNPLVVYLLYKHSLLESIISGDTSKFSPLPSKVLLTITRSDILETAWRPNQHDNCSWPAPRR